MNILTPRKALNKAYLKQKVNREELERFKVNLQQMLDDMNEGESEEYHKNLLSAFLNDTWYKGKHFINTRERTDLVIHGEKTSESKPAVLIETKKPGNKSEMPSKENLNAKAVHELIRYYLHERIDNGNISVKHLLVTDLNRFFIFNENDFDKYIYRDKQIRNAYENYKNSGKDTTFFYESIARPLLDKIQDKFTFTWFEVKSIKKYLKTSDPEKDKKLIPYYKLLSPAHLLKQPFANDSNTLDRNFYNELLHIIGLKEVKKGSQKLIQRAPENERNPGSLIENAITILKSEGILDFFTKKKEYGNDKDEQTFNIALELVITWINRILFLKLLEAQLVRYNRNDASFKFLNINTLPDYDAMNKLFFQVLAVRPEERNDQVRDAFSKIPYLNSSLFDPNELEGHTIRISNLEDEYQLPYLKQTILKDNKGKRRTGKLDSLQYLFEFLDAYDFASEGSEDIQEENKNLINASVLGLIFEKINGYKDGSFFTPGFITEYMARETIRRAVVQKFNEEKGWKLDDFEALKEHIDLTKEGREEANRIINSLKICDPAVGSGHFLVSALNEMIALKSELKVLSYRDGKRMKLYSARVENDELIIEDEDEGGIFEYGLSKQGTIIPEKQAVQEAIFHEKQTIIENCLFGVDINANSVKICRLRLWIELLKNAYYHPARGHAAPLPSAAAGETANAQPTQSTVVSELELQTLPNIDINIKTGNSLISRFSLNASLANALKRSNWRIEDYRKFVRDYKNAGSREEKQGLQAMIDQIKKDFRTEINRDNPKQKKLNKLSQELYNKYTGNKLFEEQLTKKQKQDRARLEKELTKLQKEIDDLKNNEIYRNAFEWRFEFPEVLDDEGNFLGFDVVIGNPPYIYNRDLNKNLRAFYKNTYKSSDDLYVYFTYQGLKILKHNGYVSLITPNTYFTLSTRANFRKNLLKYKYLKFTYSGFCFEDAYVETMIYLLCKKIDKKATTEFVPSPNDFVNYKKVYTDSNIYRNNIFYRFFIPTTFNKKINNKINIPLQSIAHKFSTHLMGKKSESPDLKKYNKQLKPDDLTLLGLISKGEQGLVTGNNSKYIGVITKSKKGKYQIQNSFREKLINYLGKDLSIEELDDNPRKYYEIAEKMKKEKSEPNLFGKTFLYKTIDINNVFSFANLSKETKQDGSQDECWVNYYKGNPEGYKWYVPYRTCINWTQQYVKELKEGKVTNSRWQGSNYFGSTGFGWVDYFTKQIKAFFLEEGIYSKNIVKLHSINALITDKFLVGLLNSKFISYYVKNFITSTHTLQINDGRLIPIKVPDKIFAKKFENIVDKILEDKKENPNMDTIKLEAEIDRMVYDLYGLTEEEIRIVEDSV